ELLQNPDVKYVTGMEDILGVNHNTRAVVIEELDPEQSYWYPMFIVKHDFVETFDIEVVEGRGFSKDILSDTVNAIMINETMVKNMGWTNEEAIGKRIRADGDERVIGVFKDFHILSLHSPMNNFILDLHRVEFAVLRYIAIRVNTRNYQELLSFIRDKWERLAPTRPFEYSFLDEELNNMYNDEDKFGKFSVMLTILALVIASLGLIGLTAFLAEQKTKEIGIRRAFGASVGSVIQLLSNEFIRLIIIANLVAWPVAWFFTHRWLQNFYQRIEINWVLFILAGIVTLFLALLITSYRAVRASSQNPADTLRYE
ncbi:MAG: FtsX-like permease family protein, partial [Bacteroidales bacterium]